MSGRDGRLNPKPNDSKGFSGADIGDLLRTWQMHNGDLTESLYVIAFRAAREAVDAHASEPRFRQRNAAMGAIHGAVHS